MGVNGNHSAFGFVHLSNTFLLAMMAWFTGLIELVEFTIKHSVIYFQLVLYCTIFLYPLL